MFDIGWSELVLIGLVALIVIGPKELPAVVRTIGQWMGKIRRMAADFQTQFQEAMREAEVAELKKEFDAITDSARTTFESANPALGGSDWDTKPPPAPAGDTAAAEPALATDTIPVPDSMPSAQPEPARDDPTALPAPSAPPAPTPPTDAAAESPAAKPAAGGQAA